MLKLYFQPKIIVICLQSAYESDTHLFSEHIVLQRPQRAYTAVQSRKAAHLEETMEL